MSLLDLEYRVLYFSIMEKTHIEIETNIMGKVSASYICNHMIICHCGPPRLPPCCPSRGGLSGRSPRPLACCPPRLSARDKICRQWQCRKRKIRAVWTVFALLTADYMVYNWVEEKRKKQGMLSMAFSLLCYYKIIIIAATNCWLFARG